MSMNELRIPTNRFPSRVITLEGYDPTKIPKDMEVVTIHPGWKKRPEIMLPLMLKLAGGGFFPIAVDTRISCSDQQRKGFRPIVGETNPYFEEADRWGNRYFYRQPTALLHIYEELGVTKSHFIGHSNGARVGAVAATANSSPTIFGTMIFVNGVGTGETGGFRELAISNIQAMRAAVGRNERLRDIGLSAIDSTLHFGSRLRRSWREKRINDEFPEWFDNKLPEIVSNVGSLAIIGGALDYLIAPVDKPLAEGVSYYKVDGGHSNIYDLKIQDFLVSTLLETKLAPVHPTGIQHL